MRINTSSLILLIGATVLAGCATPARVDQMSAKPTAIAAKATPLRSNVAVGAVGGGEETNPLWVSNVSATDFARALDDSLRGAALLAQNRDSSKYILSAHLNALQQPVLGLDMTVIATVNYTLIERASGKEVHRAVLTTPYTARFGDAFLGVERLKVANEGAIRENITQLIERLYGLQLSSVSVEPSKESKALTREQQLHELKQMFDSGLIAQSIYLERQREILRTR